MVNHSEVNSVTQIRGLRAAAVNKISGGEVDVVYHPGPMPSEDGTQPGSRDFETGETLKMLEDGTENGLIAQVIETEAFTPPGATEETIQQLLSCLHRIEFPLNEERAADEIRRLKRCRAKIRYRIVNGQWRDWDGWVPPRLVSLDIVDDRELLEFATSKSPGNLRTSREQRLIRLGTSQFSQGPVEVDGAYLGFINLITGAKGTGKSHTAKALVLELVDKDQVCHVFDLNGEYTQLVPDRIKVLVPGETYKLNLAEAGFGVLNAYIREMADFGSSEAARSIFEHRTPQIVRSIADQDRKRREEWNERNPHRTVSTEPFVSIDQILKIAESGRYSQNEYINDAIIWRLRRIADSGMFARKPNEWKSILDVHRELAENGGGLIVYNLAGGRARLGQLRGFVQGALQSIERICQEVRKQSVRAPKTEHLGTRAFPFVFFEEAHLYIKDPGRIEEHVTLARHLGAYTFFVTNSPRKLPDLVFEHLDNLFLLKTVHSDQIHAISKVNFIDKETLETFAPRLRTKKQVMFISQEATRNYPIMFNQRELPKGAEAAGETQNAWI